jgi:hypothetical protein
MQKVMKFFMTFIKQMNEKYLFSNKKAAKYFAASIIYR